MSTPIVPPRPSRFSAAAGTGPTAVNDSMPQVPPRPVRKLDPSPSRDLRSPFNELPNPLGGMSKRRSANNLNQEVPPRPPSVQALPSVGQEGFEYASFDVLPPEAHGFKDTVKATELETPEQTRNVSANMPLHAPKASIPQATAKSRIETVTRTDSTQAAAAGIGKAKPDDDVHTGPSDPLSRATTKQDDLRPTDLQQLRSRTSFNRSTPSLHHGSSRPGSINEGGLEAGIPEIGMQIPLNPMAGDVQAPSPAPTQSQFAPGIGFYNDGSARAHYRRKSSRQEFGPPGSFGLHGHGQEPHNQFEREWVKKHPDQAAAEGYNIHGPPRPETALTSAELNMLVNQSNDIGMGTDAEMIGTPGPDVAWEATEEYTSRMSSPKASPAPFSERKKRSSSGTQPALASPLRKTSFPFNERSSESAVVLDDGTVIHIDPPLGRGNKVTGGGEADGTLDLGPTGGNTEEEGGWYDERGEGTPILASDEIMKRPGSAFMQPAISPEVSQMDDSYYESDASYNENSRRSSMRIPSRPSSRPNSMHGEYHGGNLHRFMSHEEHHGSGMHTPLEEIEEYEPLIPEGEEDVPKPKPKAVKKRPGLEHHHFPSQDIWEDTPLSLQYSTTVETPEPPRESRAVAPPPPTPYTFETPEEEEERRNQNPHDMFSDSKTLVNKPHARAMEDHRPGVQRFPSSDIWEDTPDSMRLVTTVSSPQMDETMSPPDDRPTTTGVSDDQEDQDARATTGFTQIPKPSVPARPSRKSKLAEEVKPHHIEDTSNQQQIERDIPLEKQISPDKAKPPAIPDRPKPSVPARPNRPSRGEQDQNSDLAAAADGQISSDASRSPPVPKAKPVVPARPGGEKIAALKAGFMSDLNNRLKLGPQGPPPQAKELEPEAAVEAPKEPLADARKGRAKGPARRKPAASPSAAATVDEQPISFSMSSPFTLWHIDEEDELQVPSVVVTPPEAILPSLERELSLNEQHNTAEPPLAEPMSPERAGSPPQASLDEKIVAAQGSIDALTGEEQQMAEPEVESPSAESPSAGADSHDVTPTAADVEVKGLAPAATDEDPATNTVTETTSAEGEVEDTAKEAL